MGKGRKSKNELVDLLLSSCNDVVRTGENVLYCCKCDHRIDLNDREGLRNKILRHYSSDNHFLKCSWSTRVDVHGEVHINLRPEYCEYTFCEQAVFIIGTPREDWYWYAPYFTLLPCSGIPPNISWSTKPSSSTATGEVLHR